MMVEGENLNDPARPTTDWMNWHPDRPMVRWIAIAVAAGSALIAWVACAGPVIANVGPLWLDIENPLKLLLAAVAALQIWCLFTPRIHAAAERWLPLSLWRAMFLVGAAESGALAIVGVLATDLRWESASIWIWPTPSQAATMSFLLLALALTTTDPRWQLRMLAKRCNVQWRNWSGAARIVLALLCLHVVLLGGSLCGYWRHASAMFSAHDQLQACSCDLEGKPTSNFDNFCQRCREQIPTGARILYHGPNEGLVLAYELYPRRVFMLPQEQRDLFEYCWYMESWCRGMAADPLDRYWKWDQPVLNISQEQFIADHQITWVVTFDSSDVSHNCIQLLR